MEALYSKLYDKYTQIKTKKWSELDKLSKDQEVKFLNYVNAAEELIQHLKNENDQLRAQVDDLRSESKEMLLHGFLGSCRSFCFWYRDWSRDSALSEEVEELRKLQQERVFYSSKDDGRDNGQLNMPQGEQVISEVSNSSSRKRSRLSVSSSQDNAMQRESGKKLSKEIVSTSAFANFQQISMISIGLSFCSDHFSETIQPECCRRTIGTSGDGLDERVSASCLFQAFVEYLMDMKLSAVNQTEGWSISALHQSSGFSFSLTWMNEAAGEDVELLYRVSSLGTFERVAPEWMKEAIIFSTRMCPIFFERVSRVIKLPH
ncbi:hypothetical protein CJ030_MR1G002465 [Morella rubra]|uniref:DUF7806 domain-containing protein n=1 Tax=Morella rubra TaxID=262757 RepID=A0A6A1WM04_9ROSI|nr:hypothetical protein CJ030_MR1G002465 [Morella rubra]